MVSKLTATQFLRFMGSGRTSPALCGCALQSEGVPVDYVVKLRGALDLRGTGLAYELVAAELAAFLGLPTPEPAIIVLERELIDLIVDQSPARKAALNESVGLNFGTKHLIGVSTWPIDKAIPEEHFVIACEIFAFDALIQNPDRRYDNPNLFTRGDGFFVYDHEAAFSFLHDIWPAPDPWEIDGQRYLENHAFYKKLKSKPIELDGFMEALRNLSDAEMTRILAEVPEEWENRDSLEKIVQHIVSVRDHVDEFTEAIRRILK